MDFPFQLGSFAPVSLEVDLDFSDFFCYLAQVLLAVYYLLVQLVAPIMLHGGFPHETRLTLVFLIPVSVLLEVLV